MKILFQKKNTKLDPLRGLVLAAVMGASSVSVSQGAIIAGVNADAGTLGTFPTYSLPNLTNGAGLSSFDFSATHSSTFSDMWLSTTGAAAVLPTAALPNHLTFDLGTTYSVEDIYIWQYLYIDGLDRQVTNFSVSTSLDNLDYTTQISNQALALNLNTGQSFDLGGTVTQYVRLTINAANGSNAWVGLSEVQFDGVAAAPPSSIPEPSSTVVTGLIAALGMTLRRRK